MKIETLASLNHTHLMEVLRLPTVRLREKVAKVIIEDKLSLKQVRQLVNGMLQLSPISKAPARNPAPSK